MVDFRKVKMGQTVEHNGLTLIVASIHKGSRRKPGWVAIHCTLDGLPVKLHLHCCCLDDHGQTPVLDLVTECEYLACSECRGTYDAD